MHLPMRGIHNFEKPYYREISPMRGRPMRGPPLSDNEFDILYSFWRDIMAIRNIN